MRSRKRRNSDGLLNGGSERNSVKRFRLYNARFLLGLAAVALVMTWVVAVHRKDGLPSTNDGSGWSLSRVGDSVSADESQRHQSNHSSKKPEKKRKKSTHHDDDVLRCKPSPLEKRQTYPVYGCAEMEVRFDGLCANCFQDFVLFL